MKFNKMKFKSLIKKLKKLKQKRSTKETPRPQANAVASEGRIAKRIGTKTVLISPCPSRHTSIVGGTRIQLRSRPRRTQIPDENVKGTEPQRVASSSEDSILPTPPPYLSIENFTEEGFQFRLNRSFETFHTPFSWHASPESSANSNSYNFRETTGAPTLLSYINEDRFRRRPMPIGDWIFSRPSANSSRTNFWAESSSEANYISSGSISLISEITYYSELFEANPFYHGDNPRTTCEWDGDIETITEFPAPWLGEELVFVITHTDSVTLQTPPTSIDRNE